MRGPEGGFYSALDADSEGEEGRYYVWEESEARETLAEAELAAEAIERVLGYWGVSAAGNFEGRNILHVPLGARAEPPPELADARNALFARREQRVRPGLDDKRLCSWNALMITALADAGAALGREDFVDAAPGCARFIQESMRDDSRAPAPHLEGRRGQAQRLPRGPRLPGRGACCACTRRRSRCAGSTPPARPPRR